MEQLSCGQTVAAFCRDRGIRDSQFDPYEAGLAALYERKFPEASSQLETSLKVREHKLAVDQEAVGADQKAVADAAFFLARSRYQQGKYKEAAEAFRKRLKFTPDDPIALNDLGLSLEFIGDYTKAEPPMRRSLALTEQALTQDAPNEVTILNSYAEYLETEGENLGDKLDVAASVRGTLSRGQIAAIMPQHLSPDRQFYYWAKLIGEATSLSNLSQLLYDKKDFVGAERKLVPHTQRCKEHPGKLAAGVQLRASTQLARL